MCLCDVPSSWPSFIQYGYSSHVQLDPKSKEWMINAMKCQYPVLNKMAQENPALVRRRDMNVISHSQKDCSLEII